MKSLVWDGEESVNQPWGCTDLQVEPYWGEKGCHWHCGIDIGNPDCAGHPIYAARRGTVTALGFGYIRITPDLLDGEDWYLHGIYFGRNGQSVERGEQIGVFSDRAPSGGFVTGPHLHYEVQSGGWMNNPSTSRDPVPFLTAVFGPGESTIGGEDLKDDERAWLQVSAHHALGPRPASLNNHTDAELLNIFNTSSNADVITAFGHDGYDWIAALQHGWPRDIATTSSVPTKIDLTGTLHS